MGQLILPGDDDEPARLILRPPPTASLWAARNIVRELGKTRRLKITMVPDERGFKSLAVDL
jgi:hypothetical protein